MKRFGLTTLAAAALVATATSAPAYAGDTLESVQDRGYLNCGVNTGLPGFAMMDDEGEWRGFDADFCRAIAAAVLGDSDDVEFVGVTSANRFAKLKAGEIDVLIRNTTYTLTRDTVQEGVGFDFAPTTFYDGQGFMVWGSTGITTIDGLAGATVCVAAGTTSAQNLEDFRGEVALIPMEYVDTDAAFAAYDAQECDAITSDLSGLVGKRVALTSASDHAILSGTISKEPLGPAVRHGDNQWADVVRWVVFATYLAEEMGITHTTVVTDARGTNQDAEVKRLLGREGDLGEKLGLDNDWAYDLIRAVGNYAEIYDRNLGPDTNTSIPRSLQNSSWKDGGLLYAPPAR
ncbi:MAG: amino acid ABC transporter substrate-binding protein [Deltaproteobacteria bacterium]|nr:amino acid ABC transporter substrate-binding protein [Deltaproteobacteria bacterium]